MNLDHFNAVELCSASDPDLFTDAGVDKKLDAKFLFEFIHREIMVESFICPADLPHQGFARWQLAHGVKENSVPLYFTELQSKCVGIDDNLQKILCALQTLLMTNACEESCISADIGDQHECLSFHDLFFSAI